MEGKLNEVGSERKSEEEGAGSRNCSIHAERDRNFYAIFVNYFNVLIKVERAKREKGGREEF